MVLPCLLCALVLVPVVQSLLWELWPAVQALHLQLFQEVQALHLQLFQEVQVLLLMLQMAIQAEIFFGQGHLVATLNEGCDVGMEVQQDVKLM
ncbi:unnamed protein product [Urochloa humidicola]